MNQPSLSRGAMLGMTLLALSGFGPYPAERVEAATPEANIDKFVVPNKPLILKRTIRRTLVDGQEIISHRSYTIQIKAENGGYRIDGHLHDVSVEAPPKLAALASLERNRPDDTLFPLYLNASGQIISPQYYFANPAAQSGVTIATAITSDTETTSDNHQSAAETIGQISQAASKINSSWPLDLFHPAAGEHSQTKIVNFPNGAQGKVTITMNAKLCSEGGIMQSLTRSIITETEGNQRLNQEQWTLTPKEG